jgi:hypothetical protein
MSPTIVRGPRRVRTISWSSVPSKEKRASRTVESWIGRDPNASEQNATTSSRPTHSASPPALDHPDENSPRRSAPVVVGAGLAAVAVAIGVKFA